MENTLQMRTEASYSLNFMVYLQNIFLNQRQSRDEMKFPYISTHCAFQEEFEMRYRELWDDLSKRIREDTLNDLKIFSGEKNLFYECLFANNDVTLNEFEEIYQSFKVWWISTAGRFAVERSIDVHGQNIYMELANSLIKDGIKPRQRLNISLIYDACSLVDLEPASYFAVLSLEDCIMSNKELIRKLRLSID